MTKEELWAAYVKRNPAFADDDTRIMIRVKSLREMIEQAHDKGRASAVKAENIFDTFFNPPKQ